MSAAFRSTPAYDDTVTALGIDPTADWRRYLPPPAPLPARQPGAALDDTASTVIIPRIPEEVRAS